jgi:hypothetical protein
MLLVLSGCTANRDAMSALTTGGSFVVPTVSPTEQAADDERMNDEVQRCRDAAPSMGSSVPPEDKPFLDQPIVPEGPFKGCVVDVSQSRPVTRVKDPAQILWPAAPDQAGTSHVLVANLQHADSFWFADIDLAGIREVLVQMEHTGSLNHGQVRVTFDPGAVRLFPQGAPSDRSPTVRNDLTLTADGIAPIGVDRPAGILPPRQYPLLYRVMSTEQKVRIMTDADGRLHVVEQFRILTGADPEQLVMAGRFFTAWIEHGSRAQFRTMFQLVPIPPLGSLNCTSALFQILDETVAYPDAGWRARVLDEFLPIRIPTYLTWRGYILEEIRKSDLHAELGVAGAV